jgi:hypothetical protein
MTGATVPFVGRHHLFLRPLHVGPRTQAIAFGVAIGALLVFVATGVSLYEDLTATVEVSIVNWYSEGQLLGTSSGFAVHTSQAFNLTLTCFGLCYRFNGASVGTPFHLVSTQIYYYPSEYVNVTAQAPSIGYSGPLSITLSVL